VLTELVELPGGSFRMGSTSFYPEEAPIHTVIVPAFAIERHPVTNAQFAEFIAATGYTTVAQQPLDPTLYPGANPDDLCPGAMVFRPTAGPVDLRDWRQWWDWVPGASWRHPFGPDSDIADKPDHPVVQVAYPDAAAYAGWAGRRLPSEAEWEYAARAGTTTPNYWGDSSDEVCKYGNVLDQSFIALGPLDEDSKDLRVHRCNDGAPFSAPVGSYLPNKFGLYDTAGNQWELVQDCWHDDYEGAPNDGSEWKSVGECGARTARGTSWINPDYGIRSARSTQRYTVRPSLRAAFIGFRVARD